MAKKELQKNFEECWCYRDLTVLQRATILTIHSIVSAQVTMTASVPENECNKCLEECQNL